MYVNRVYSIVNTLGFLRKWRMFSGSNPDLKHILVIGPVALNFDIHWCIQDYNRYENYRSTGERQFTVCQDPSDRWFLTQKATVFLADSSSFHLGIGKGRASILEPSRKHWILVLSAGIGKCKVTILVGGSVQILQDEITNAQSVLLIVFVCGQIKASSKAYPIKQSHNGRVYLGWKKARTASRIITQQVPEYPGVCSAIILSASSRMMLRYSSFGSVR